MDLLLLLARLLHIGLGVFWAGTMIFNALYLVPAIRDAGPEGAKVGANLLRSGFLNVMPVVASLTILSGLWLYWKASAGFDRTYMGSGAGMAYGIGAVTAIIALGFGVHVVRASMLKAFALGQAAASMQSPEKETQLAAAQALRTRAAKAGRVVAALLTITVIAMAIGRYV